MKFVFIDAQAAKKAFPVVFMCHLLEVSCSGFYAWRSRPVSARQSSDLALSRLITTLFDEHKGRYGVRRIHAELSKTGHRVGYKRVQRLMKQLGLRSVHPRPFKRTTLPSAPAAHLLDLVLRQVHPAGPNQTWVGDITYIRTWTGWAYLATVIDCHSRKVVGWSIADHMRTAPDHRRPRHGNQEPPSRCRCHLPLRPWQPIHLRTIPQLLCRQQRPTVSWQDRHLLRQRRRGILLRHHQERTRPPTAVAHAGPAQHRAV